VTWVKARKKEYAEGVRNLMKYRDSLTRLDLREQTPEELQEISIVEGMISDMNYAIEWMRTGRQPHTRRGVDIKDAYKRSILMDMDLIPNKQPEQEQRITDVQKQAVVKIMMKLSPRELECYLLHVSNGLSLAEIADELKIKKRSVQDYVDRAKSKVAQAV